MMEGVPISLWARHVLALAMIFTAAFAVNAAFYVGTNLSPAYNQSSDAAEYTVEWETFSPKYNDAFVHDTMFQQFPSHGVPTGVAAVGRALVAGGAVIGIGPLTMSVATSVVSLALFLAGVYAVALYATRRSLLALVIALVSIIPVISLGLSSWGFLAGGFVPKETSLAIAVWLTLLYLRGIERQSHKTIAIFFVLLGLAANFYPPVFYHYCAILLVAEVFRARWLRIEHIGYFALFLLASPVALYDIFVKAGSFAPADITVVTNHYLVPLHSASYLFFHYLRKQIIYAVALGGLWWANHRLWKVEQSPVVRALYCVWWSSLILSLVGVGTELWAPALVKYLLSRTSVWFYFVSMLLIGDLAYRIAEHKWGNTWYLKIGFGVVLGGALLLQTSVQNVWSGILDFRAQSATYAQYLSVVTQLHSVVPAGDLVLANPDDQANTIRTYGEVGVWVASKDGNISLFDGNAGRAWYMRYTDTQQVFATKDLAAIRAFALARGLHYYFFNRADIQTGSSTLQHETVIQDGAYGLAKF